MIEENRSARVWTSHRIWHSFMSTRLPRFFRMVVLFACHFRLSYVCEVPQICPQPCSWLCTETMIESWPCRPPLPRSSHPLPLTSARPPARLPLIFTSSIPGSLLHFTPSNQKTSLSSPTLPSLVHPLPHSTATASFLSYPFTFYVQASTHQPSQDLTLERAFESTCPTNEPPTFEMYP